LAQTVLMARHRNRPGHLLQDRAGSYAHCDRNGDGRMRSFFFFGFLLFFLSGCGGSTDQSLAGQGAINDGAPVKAQAQNVIDAPAAQVWNILVDIQDWPRWQTDITAVSIKQEPAVGVRFEWSTGQGSIHSRIALFQPQRRLAWTGRLFIFHAIHAWILTPLPDGRTLVQTRESMSGWPIGLLSRKKLKPDDDAPKFVP
jgi:hypothetical protein